MPTITRLPLLDRYNHAGARRFTMHLALLGALATGITLTGPLGLVLVVPYGIALVALFAPLHESTHGTAFASRAFNRLAAALCGAAVLVPPRWFQHFHFAHHRYLGDPVNEPELGTAKIETRRQYLRTLSGTPIHGTLVRTLVRNAAGRCQDPFVPHSARRIIAWESRLILLTHGCLAGASALTGSWSWCVFWLVPFLAGQPFLRAFLMAEHHGCPSSDSAARTTLTHPAVRSLSWNMSYHAEHHGAPAVPFHQLPALHARLATRPRRASPGYLAFHRAVWRDLGRSNAQHAVR